MSTIFKDSPFSVLGISLLDTKRSIVEAAELHDSDVNNEDVVQAKNALIVKRTKVDTFVT